MLRAGNFWGQKEIIFWMHMIQKQIFSTFCREWNDSQGLERFYLHFEHALLHLLLNLTLSRHICLSSPQHKLQLTQLSPSPSPTESKRLFYTSVSLLLFHILGYLYHLSKFLIYGLEYCIGVFLSGLFHSA